MFMIRLEETSHCLTLDDHYMAVPTGNASRGLVMVIMIFFSATWGGGEWLMTVKFFTSLYAVNDFAIVNKNNDERNQQE